MHISCLEKSKKKIYIFFVPIAGALKYFPTFFLYYYYYNYYKLLNCPFRPNRPFQGCAYFCTVQTTVLRRVLTCPVQHGQLSRDEYVFKKKEKKKSTC